MDALVASRMLTFEDWRFDPQERALFRRAPDGAWSPVSVGSRAIAILAVLLEHAGEVVSKDTIMDTVWPRVAVESNNLTVQLTALRRVLDSGRAGGSCIQTVPGRGYRFTPRVTCITDDVAEPPLAEAVTPPPDSAMTQWTRRRAWRWIAASASGLALAVLVIIVAWGSWRAEPALPPRLSIVVLPFENLSDNRGDDYLADAITDDVTTELTRLPAMFVIARDSAFTYQGKPIDVRRIGEELGVRYALEGSVRKLGDVLRVNAQLISTETGTHLWADRFDQQLKDLSAGQEAIVLRIGQTLNVALTDIESARSKRERPANPDAFDLILRARSIGLHPMGPREHAERKVLFEEALRLDPGALLAMTGLVDELVRLTFTGYSPTGDELERAASLITKAEAMDPNHQFVLGGKAFVQYAQGRFSDSIATLRRLLDQYPNYDTAYSQIGDCLIKTGHAEDAIPMIEKAMRINPRSSYAWSRYDNMSLALLLLGRDEESIVWTQRALTANPDNAVPILAQEDLRLAAAYARLGQLDEAHRALAEANRLWPYDTARGHWPGDPALHVFAMQIERFQTALRLAGERDHADEAADSGVPPDDNLHRDLAGPTPTTAPGATTITTPALARMLEEHEPIIIDPMLYWWGRSIPGAVALRNVGLGDSTTDAIQSRLRLKMQALTRGDPATPIVAMGWNSERFDGRNLALRLTALGYTNVYWYRGGREAWEVAGLPETHIDPQDW